MVKLLRVCLALLVLLLITGPVFAQSPQIIMVLWHDLQWSDILTSPFIDNNQLAVGLMNTRIGGGALIPGAYLTISSGARAYGVVGAQRMLHGSELSQGIEAKEIYQLRTGSFVSEHKIINLEIAGLLQAATQARYPLKVGYLAEKLIAAGFKIGAYGNSDLRDEIARWAALVAMDAAGQVAYGNVSPELLLEDLSYPGGKKTNYALLLEEVVNSEVDVAVVDIGDPYRFSLQQRLFLSEQEEQLRRKIAADCWQFIRNLQASLPESKILVLSPFSGDQRAKDGQWMAPLLMVGQGAGLLTSATTRWSGIVTNIDIGPTILDWLGLTKGEMIGRPLELDDDFASKTAIARLLKLEKQLFSLAKYRSQVLRTFVGLQIGLYLFSLALLIIQQPLPLQLIKFIQLCLLICLALPLGILVLPGSWLLSLLVLVIVGISFYRSKDYLKTIMIIALVTAGALMIDVLRGFWWIRYSFLGYDAIAGARYYGIGNEYMGILVGSLIMGWSILRHYWNLGKGWLDFMVFLTAIMIIAAPQWGTNVGGGITAVVGCGLLWISLQQVKIRPRTLLFLVIAVVLGLSILMVFDFSRPESAQSHIGQTVIQIKQLGFTAIWQIITRKLAMNYNLLRYSIWSRALLVAIFAMAGNLLWPNKYIYWLTNNYPRLVNGLVGTIVAAITALIFNDSGVVAAATCIFFAATTMLVLALALKHNLFPS